MQTTPELGPTINITSERDAAIQAILQTNEFTAQQENENPLKVWKKPALPFTDFQNHFTIVRPEFVMRAGGVIPWLETELHNGNPVNILNAAGAPRVLADLHTAGVLTNGVALGLANKHLPSYNDMHIYPVNGDMLLEKLWTDLEAVKI